MSETVTVIEAKNPNPWQHGITYYDMIFDRNGQRFACSWGTKGGEPQIGEEVTGEFSQKSDGSWKFSKGTKDNPGQSAPRSSEASTSNTSKPASSGGETNWTERNAEIRRQHSQEMALRVLELRQTQMLDTEHVQGLIVNLADWFDADAIAAGGRAAKAANPPEVLQTSRPIGGPTESPVDFSGARKTEPGYRDLDEYGQLLDNAGLVVAGAREKVAEYMATKLSEERLTKALTGLQDLDRQGAVLAQLKTETEEWIGGPLPQGDALDGDEDPVPF